MQTYVSKGTCRVADTVVNCVPSGTDLITKPAQLLLESAAPPSGPLTSLAVGCVGVMSWVPEARRARRCLKRSSLLRRGAANAMPAAKVAERVIRNFMTTDLRWVKMNR